MIGMHKEGNTVFLAKMRKERGRYLIDQLFSTSEGNARRYALEHSSPKRVCGVSAEDLLIKGIDISIPRRTPWKKVLAYQLESLHFFPPEQMLSLSILHGKPERSLRATCFTTTKQQIHSLMEKWSEKNLDPHHISTVPNALMRYAKRYHEAPDHFCLVHIDLQSCTCVQVAEGRVRQAYSLSSGISSLVEAARKSGYPSFSSLDLGKMEGKLDLLARKLRAFYEGIQTAFSSFSLPEKVPLIFTGQIDLAKNTIQPIKKILAPYVEKTLPEKEEVRSEEPKSKYAISIGLVLDTVAKDALSLEFRQGEFLAESFIKQYFWSMSLCLTLYLTTLLGGYSYSSSYLKKEEALCDAFFQKVHAKDEQALKRSLAGKSAPLKADLQSWESLLAKESKASPWNAPCPKASSALFWIQGILQGVGAALSSFSYTVEKRPTLQSPRTSYVVRIEATVPNASRSLQERLEAAFWESPELDQTYPHSCKEEQGALVLSFYYKKGGSL
ncbi:MAG: hypothetical protein AAGF04_03480 [Chlamydiota bacterium]